MTTRDYRVHEDWSTPAFGYSRIAPDTGPFASSRFLRSWYRHRGGDGKVLLVESNDALLPFYSENGTIRFLGEADLTDYHTPLGTPSGIADLAQAFFTDLEGGTIFELDSLPHEAADPLEAGLVATGTRVERKQHELAAVLTLPASFEEWLAAIGKKERHEVRRKRRRFEEGLGSPHLIRAEGQDAIAAFARLHRAASGEKATFMTPPMEAFFTQLHEESGAVIDLLTNHDNDVVAAAFGFENESGYYLYNSAYDPEVRHASPGIVMLASLIERAIERGHRVFDFLKGDETYKFRHGASPRSLDSLNGVIGT
jgi:CelD/BcsL family acetyltransferase involved in cellulose biosynthesis